MKNNIIFERRQVITLVCALLLLGSIFSLNAFADSDPVHASDYTQDVNVIYTVTEDMIAKPTASPIATATPTPIPTGKPAEDNPKTGDTSNIPLYLCGAALSLAGIAGGIYYIRKYKENANNE